MLCLECCVFVARLGNAVPYNAVTIHKRIAFPSPTQWHIRLRMNRLLSFFKGRLSRPTSSSFFSTNSSRLAQALQPDMAQALHHPSSSETFGNFDLINRVELGLSEITVSSWRSRVTGLNVVHLDYEGERFTAALTLPSSYVHLCSFNSSHREWLFCGGHREYANYASTNSCLSYNAQFSMILVVRTPWNSEYTLGTRGFVPDAATFQVWFSWARRSTPTKVS